MDMHDDDDIEGADISNTAVESLPGQSEGLPVYRFAAQYPVPAVALSELLQPDEYGALSELAGGHIDRVMGTYLKDPLWRHDYDISDRRRADELLDRYGRNLCCRASISLPDSTEESGYRQLAGAEIASGILELGLRTRGRWHNKGLLIAWRQSMLAYTSDLLDDTLEAQLLDDPEQTVVLCFSTSLEDRQQLLGNPRLRAWLESSVEAIEAQVRVKGYSWTEYYWRHPGWHRHRNWVLRALGRAED
jgi:hypothetical protein